MTKNKLLLIIDMQEGFRYPETESIIPNILKVYKKFEKIACTKFVDTKGSMFEKQLNWITFQNVEKQEILKELIGINNIEISHNTYNPITEELKGYIEDNEISSIYISGIYTDVSVLVASMILFDLGIETFVISDACNSVHNNQNNNIHESAIESLSHVLGKDHLITADDLI